MKKIEHPLFFAQGSSINVFLKRSKMEKYDGEVSEWLKEHDWKSCMFRKEHRGFESLSLHHEEQKKLGEVDKECDT